MKDVLRKILGGIGLLVVICIAIYAMGYVLTPNSKNLPETAYITLKDAPDFGQWMYTPENEPAHWLGQEYQGKELREPINIVVIDRKASSKQDAETHFLMSTQAAGYPNRTGHSSGYKGEAEPRQPGVYSHRQ
ncbi:MAG: hypothetical protein ACM3QW_03385, partial [Ignavibacteriales bacterium]